MQQLSFYNDGRRAEEIWCTACWARFVEANPKLRWRAVEPSELPELEEAAEGDGGPQFARKSAGNHLVAAAVAMLDRSAGKPCRP